MSSTVTTLTRKFKIGPTLLDDPAPHLPAEDSLKLFLPNYPFISTAQLGEPECEGSLLIYPVQKPQIQTKGAVAAMRVVAPTKKRARRHRTIKLQPATNRRDIEGVIDALNAWGTAPTTTPAASPRWIGALNHVKRVLDRDPSPISDAFLIPLA